MKHFILCVALLASIVLAKAQSGTEPFTKTVINTTYDFEHPFEIFLDPKFPADSAFINTRSGRIYIVDLSDGGRREILDIRSSVNFTRNGTPVTGIDQDGMFGMAVHPDAFKGMNKDSLYVAYCYNSSGKKTRIAKYYCNPVTRMLSNGSTLIEGLPASNDHNGGRLEIGPDFKIYYSCGDQGANQFSNACIEIKSQKDITAAELGATNYTNYAGHILRLNLDGSIPTDNPTFASVKSHVYTKGHRNPQGLAFETNNVGQVLAGAKLYSSEQGAVIDDEVNLITSGGNYGWPYISGYNDDVFYTYKNWSIHNTGAINCTNYPGECATATNMTGGNAPRAESSWPTPSQYTNPLFSQAAVASPDCSNYLARPTVAWSSIKYYNRSTGIPGWNNSLLLPTLKRSAIIRFKLNATNDGIVGDTIQYFRPTGSSGLNRYRDIAISTAGTILFTITDSVGATSGPSNGNTAITDRGKLVAFTYTGPTLSLPPTNNSANVVRNDLVETYPNPVVNTLIINTSNVSYRPFTLKLIDVSGNIVLTKTVSQATEYIDVQHIRNGQYLLQLVNRNGFTIANKKIIVVH